MNVLNKSEYSVIVIGGGPAGMSAALAAKKRGADRVLIIERECETGGILEQCIHNGFGLQKFREELTGPEYAERYRGMTAEAGVECMTETMAVAIDGDEYDRDGDFHTVTVMNSNSGYTVLRAAALVLAMGCRERSRGALSIPGSRPAGVYTAGTAQKLVNVKGLLPGKDAVILGSGDIGLIMARRMTLEGARVKAVCEIMPDSGGLTRNIVQCLKDYGIPLLLNTTVTEIHGEERVTGVTLAKVDGELKPIPGTEEYIACDTLLLSVGLIPENELSQGAGVKLNPKTNGPEVDENRETSVKGIFACGNVVKVHELVDFVSDEGETAGTAAAEFAMGMAEHRQGGAVLKQIPQKKGVKNLSAPGEQAVICTVCPNGCRVSAVKQGEEYAIFGNLCSRGRAYALAEMTLPTRTLTTVMAAEDGSMIPVKTDRPVDRELLSKILEKVNCKTLVLPISAGDIIIENVDGHGANLVCCKTRSCR